MLEQNKTRQKMVFEKKEYLITGKVDPKIKEKVRLKLRLLLNKYSKCIIGISNEPDGRLRFRFEQMGYRGLFYVFKSTSFDTANFYTETFKDLYINELLRGSEEFSMAIDEGKKGPYYLFVAAKKQKGGY